MTLVCSSCGFRALVDENGLCHDCQYLYDYDEPTVFTQPDGPLIERVDGAQEVPATWCVVVCEQGCQQSWAVDTTDFDPPLTATDVERLLAPPLLEHEQEHQGVWSA